MKIYIYSTYADQHAARLLQRTAAAENRRNEDQQTNDEEHVQTDVEMVALLRHRDDQRRIAEHPYREAERRETNDLWCEGIEFLFTV